MVGMKELSVVFVIVFLKDREGDRVFVSCEVF